MGFARFQAVFRVYFEFRNVLRSIPYSYSLAGKVGEYLEDHMVFRGNNGASFVPTGIQGRL